MFKKNKDKLGNTENSVEFLSASQKHVKQQILDVPELFSSPDMIIDNNKTSIKTENIEIDPKINIEQVDNIKIENPVSKDIERMIVNNEETIGVRKISNKMKDNPVENTVNKTVEDILNDISSKIVNETDVIDENLIDELADLNEDLNSVCKVKSIKFV